MTSVLEAALHTARAAPFPGSWAAAQMVAALVALSYVWIRARSWPLLTCFALALPAGALGAFALGFAFRLVDRTAGRDVDLLGVAAYGALAGVALAFVRLSRRHAINALEGLDLIAPALALLVAIGRLGCFLSGCDAGHVSDSALSVRFPAGSAVFRDHVTQGLVLASDAWSLAVHPAQLYEAGTALGLAALGHHLGRRSVAPGLAFGVTALGYTVVRVLVDTLRFPAPDATYGLATSLLVGIGIVVHSLRNQVTRGEATSARRLASLLSPSRR